MAEFTLDILIEALRESAGEDEDVNLDGDIIDTPFEELGYDSLALLNTIGAIERRFTIKLPDGTASEADTPRELLRFVNDGIGSVA